MSDNPKLQALLTSLQLVLERIRILIDGKLELDANAVSASKLATARTISLSGDGTGSISFDGTANRAIPLTLTATGVAAAIYGSSSQTLRLNVDTKGRLLSVEALDIPHASVSGSGLVQLDSSLSSTAVDKAPTALALAQVNAVAVAALPATARGAANGVASLDSDGKVPASQLPSFVDDVLEFANAAGFPASGETGKLYVALDTNRIYRWSGSAYIWISASTGSADTAVKLATARTINGVAFDGTANITLPTINTTGNQSIDGVKTFNSTIVGNVSGSAGSASKLITARPVTLNGDVTGTGNFDGTADLVIPVVLSNSGATAGVYGSEANIPAITVDVKGRITAAENVPLPAASTSKDGIVRLSSSVSSTSTSLAATPAAVKIAYDLANSMIRTNDKGAPNGVATLDANGQVPAAQLPSYVDDVLEFATLSEFPTTGESGKIYVDVATTKMYRWSGTVYINIGANSASADVALALATARTISATGDATWSVSFDGSANRTSALTLANSGVTAGTYGDANNIPRLVIDAKGRVTAVSLIARPTSADDAGKLTTARTIALTGDGTASGSFDGSANLSLALTLSNSGVTAGTYGKVTVDSKGRVTAGAALVEADLPSISIAKTTGLQTALDAKFSTANLSSATNSTSTTAAATSAAVKSAYDLAALAIPLAQRGVANGVATLDASGLIPSAQLPSYVDDVLEFATQANFPATGETGKIYVATTPGLMFRWSGTVYIQIGGSAGAADNAVKLATPRTISTTGDATWTVTFDGSANVTAALTLANSGVTAGAYTKVTVDAKGRVTAASQQLAADIPLLNQDTTGLAARATVLATTRALTIGSTAKNFDGSAALTWSLAEIGAAAATHTHAYLPLTGGSVTGQTLFTATTATTSATTGAVVISGGLGVGGDIYAAGDVAAYSDIRLKTDIAIIEGALDRVLALRGVTYLRKDTGKVQTGLIAQEVQAVLPEAVSGEETLAVAYGNLAGLFVEAIKELKGQVDDLRAEVAELRK